MFCGNMVVVVQAFYYSFSLRGFDSLATTGYLKKERLIMDKTHQVILDTYRFRLRNYCETGIGNESKITGVVVTKSMIFNCLERYIELGGDLSEVKIDDKIYAEFKSEMLLLR